MARDERRKIASTELDNNLQVQTLVVDGTDVEQRLRDAWAVLGIPFPQLNMGVVHAQLTANTTVAALLTQLANAVVATQAQSSATVALLASAIDDTAARSGKFWSSARTLAEVNALLTRVSGRAYSQAEVDALLAAKTQEMMDYVTAQILARVA